MAERQAGKPEIATQKKSIKLAPAIGDWTTYKPLKVLVKKVKSGLYGFDRLSQLEIDAFLNINYHFTEKLLQKFKVDLQLAIELFSVQAEQTTYLNFLRTLSGQIVQVKLAVPGHHETISLILELTLANSIINHALGSRDLEPLNRGLTEAENDVLATALTEYLPLFTEAYDNCFETPEVSIVGSPDVTIDQSLNPSATFVCFTAEIALGDNPPGRLIIGYHGTMLKSLISAYLHKSSVRPLNFSRLSQYLLNKLAIPVVSALGGTTLTAQEIEELETGDVVTLGTDLKAAVPLNIGKEIVLLCQPGVRNKKLAVRVAGLDAEELDIEPPPLEVKAPAPVKLPDETAEETEAAVEPAGETNLEEEEILSDEDFEDFDLDDETEETKTEEIKEEF